MVISTLNKLLPQERNPFSAKYYPNSEVLEWFTYRCKTAKKPLVGWPQIILITLLEN